MKDGSKMCIQEVMELCKMLVEAGMGDEPFVLQEDHDIDIISGVCSLAIFNKKGNKEPRFYGDY